MLHLQTNQFRLLQQYRKSHIQNAYFQLIYIDHSSNSLINYNYLKFHQQKRMLHSRKLQQPLPIKFTSPYTEPQLFKGLNNGINNAQIQNYQYGSNEIEKQLPLPSQSIKLPYKQHPTRFINTNRKHRQLDYLKSQIETKCELEQLHYQAKIQKMKQENMEHRQKLEHMLMKGNYSPALFQQYRMYGLIPNGTYQEGARYVPNLLDNIKNPNRLPANQQQKLTKKQRLKLLMGEKDKIIDQIDKLRMQDTSALNLPKRIRAKYSSSDSQDDSSDRKSKDKKQQRQQQLDYIYQRNQHDKKLTSPHFQKKLLNKQAAQSQQKRKQFQWVKQVMKAKKVKFQIEQEQSGEDSSSISGQSAKRSYKNILDIEESAASKSRYPPPQQNMQPRESVRPILINNIRNTDQRANTNRIGLATRNVLQTYRGGQLQASRGRRDSRDYDDSRYEYIMHDQQKQRQRQNHVRNQSYRGNTQNSNKVHYIHPKLANQTNRYEKRRTQRDSYYSSEHRDQHRRY